MPGKAADEHRPEAYPVGYVEDWGESRTKLEASFTFRYQRRRAMTLKHTSRLFTA